jgi:hypothetical protein
MDDKPQDNPRSVLGDASSVTTPPDPEQISVRVAEQISKLSPPLQTGLADLLRRKQGRA